METRILKSEQLEGFEQYLIQEEKSVVTVEKYLRDVRAFFEFAGERNITKELVMEYKKNLNEKNYAVRSINSMLTSVNIFLKFCGWSDCQVKGIKMQRQISSPEEKELTKTEYQKLLDAAKNKPRLQMLLQTICATGIRISEVQYFTVEAVKKGEIMVSCKNKNRVVLVPKKLKKMLLKYAKQNEITEGVIFRTKNGKTLNRSNIWSEMKQLCEKAGVKKTEVFPHNLRKLFARTFYLEARHGTMRIIRMV